MQHQMRSKYRAPYITKPVRASRKGGARRRVVSRSAKACDLLHQQLLVVCAERCDPPKHTRLLLIKQSLLCWLQVGEILVEAAELALRVATWGGEGLVNGGCRPFVYTDAFCIVYNRTSLTLPLFLQREPIPSFERHISYHTNSDLGVFCALHFIMTKAHFL